MDLTGMKENRIFRIHQENVFWPQVKIIQSFWWMGKQNWPDKKMNRKTIILSKPFQSHEKMLATEQVCHSDFSLLTSVCILCFEKQASLSWMTQKIQEIFLYTMCFPSAEHIVTKTHTFLW